MAKANTQTKILIVDDDKFLLDMYSVKFSENGFDVQACPNASEAIDKLSTDYRPDICLVDVIMPGMDGFTFIETIKSKGFSGDSAIIILSNLGQKEDIERGLSVGADGYIVKASATPSEVVAKVKEIIANKK